MTNKNTPESQTPKISKSSTLNPQEQINLHANEEKTASQAFKEATGSDFASGEEYVAPQAQSFEESMQNMIAWIKEKKAKASAYIPKASELAGEPDGSSNISKRSNKSSNPLSKEELEQSQQDIADGILGYIFKVDKDGNPLDLDNDIQQPYNPSRFKKAESTQEGSEAEQSYQVKDSVEAKQDKQDKQDKQSAQALPNQEDMLKWIKEMKAKAANNNSSSEEK